MTARASSFESVCVCSFLSHHTLPLKIIEDTDKSTVVGYEVLPNTPCEVRSKGQRACRLWADNAR